jgi:hypothetical protein
MILDLGGALTKSGNGVFICFDASISQTIILVFSDLDVKAK